MLNINLRQGNYSLQYWMALGKALTLGLILRRLQNRECVLLLLEFSKHSQEISEIRLAV
jgi:hypothetical protein